MQNAELIKKGKRRLAWAETHMKVLSMIRARFTEEKPFENIKIGMALHTEAKTGVLALTLRDGGAKIRLASCNPLSTDDAVAKALNDIGIETYAQKGESESEYYENLNKVADLKPDIIIDDGCDLIYLTHTQRKELIGKIKGANEETTTGIVRLRVMERKNALRYAVIAVNNADMKYLFDNRHGTGQSTLDGIMTATNLLIAGKNVIVAGYGWCGRGIAARAHGMGANVTVTEVNPIRAIEAKLAGFNVMPMKEAVKNADFIISATGCRDIITKDHLSDIKDGCILANAGHFDCEISREDLDRYAVRKEKVRDGVEKYKLKNGKTIYLLGEGRLVNLAIGQGHPVEIMDMSFSIQALCAEYILKNYEKLENKVYDVPHEINETVANLKLQTMNVHIDKLTEKQISYLNSFDEGT